MTEIIVDHTFAGENLRHCARCDRAAGDHQDSVPDRRLKFGVDLPPAFGDWGPDDIICAYVDGVQVAGAVKLGTVYAEATGCQYHVTSSLAEVKPLLCRDKDEAVRWLTLLADLYEGKMRASS